SFRLNRAGFIREVDECDLVAVAFRDDEDVSGTCSGDAANHVSVYSFLMRTRCGALFCILTSVCPGTLLQEFGDLGVSLTPRKIERGLAPFVSHGRVGAMDQQESHDLLPRVATVSENDRLDQRCPTDRVSEVHINVGVLQEVLHDAY